MSTAQGVAGGGGGSAAVITTVAGTGVAGSSGEGVPATSAELNRPYGVAVDAAGGVLIADYNNHRVRRVAPDGKISTFAGSGSAGFDGDGGPAVAARLDLPYDVAVDGAGAVYIADWDNHRVRKVAADGTISTFSGTGQGFGGGEGIGSPTGRLNLPQWVAVDGAGTVYVTEYRRSRVRRIAGDGTVGPFAGTGQPGFDGDAGPAVAAKLNYPQGVAVDGTGALYIADSGNHRVRKVAPDGTISTVAGTGDAGFGGDGGAAALARLSCPRAVVVDSAGVLYITDAGNHRVRKVAPDGTISTVAGTGDAGFGGDGGAATSAQLNSPYGLAVDDAGDLYIADCDNHRVRKVVSVKAGGLPASGTVVWWVNARSNMRMTVAGESLKDAAEIHQALASSRPAQRWRLVVVDRAGGQVFYRIENVRSGKVVEAAASAAGAVARQRAYAGDGAYHQQWELIVVGAGGGAPPVYEIVNRGSGLLLRVDSNLPPVRQGQAQADPRDGRWQLVPA